MSDVPPIPRHRSRETQWYFGSAAAFAGIYLIASLSDWRNYTTVLSGTISGKDVRAFLGMFYLFLHFIFVVLVPILIIAGGFNLLLERRQSPVNAR